MRTTQRSLLSGLCLLLCAPQMLQAQSGALDPTFNGTGYVIDPVNKGDGVQKILVQDDQKILSIGMSWDSTYTAHAYVFRYHPDGTPDAGFATNGVFSYTLDNEALFYSGMITAEGKILLVGATTDYQTYRMLLIQLNADGSPDNAFGTNGVVLQTVGLAPQYNEDFIYDVAQDALGNILVCGSSHDANYVRRPVVVRFTSNGTLDTSFGVDGVATIPVELVGASSFRGVVVQPDGKIVATGNYGQTELWYLLLLVRFNADGSLDTTFSTDGIVKHNYGNVDDTGYDLKLTPDGSILVAGKTVTITYNYSALLMKFTPDGEVDATFGTAGAVEEDLDNFDYGWGVEVQTDGRIVMAGTSGVGPPNGFDLAVWKYNADGTPDPGFGTNGLAHFAIGDYYTMIYGLDLQADGKILIGGQARTANNENYFFTARLQNDIASGISDDQTDGDAFVVFPNPFQDLVTVRTGTWTGSVRVQLFNADGRLVLEETRSSMEPIVVRTGHLSSGTYVLRLRTDDTSNTTILVK